MRLMSLAGLVVLLLPLCLGWTPGREQQAATRAADAPAPEDAVKAVEADMHEFMEYVFQPTFRRLKEAMAAAPADNAKWKAVKSDALILAESGNLLLGRPAEEDVPDWLRHSLEVRESGGRLYQAAKKNDYAAARSEYETMVAKCNACHQQFAGGEYQLKP